MKYHVSITRTYLHLFSLVCDLPLMRVHLLGLLVKSLQIVLWNVQWIEPYRGMSLSFRALFHKACGGDGFQCDGAISFLMQMLFALFLWLRTCTCMCD